MQLIGQDGPMSPFNLVYFVTNIFTFLLFYMVSQMQILTILTICGLRSSRALDLYRIVKANIVLLFSKMEIFTYIPTSLGFSPKYTAFCTIDAHEFMSSLPRPLSDLDGAQNRAENYFF